MQKLCNLISKLGISVREYVGNGIMKFDCYEFKQ